MAGAVGYWGRRRVLHRWRGLLAVALLTGGLFGLATAAAASARRTASAYTRFLDATNAFEAIYINYAADDSAVLAATDLRGLPGVLAVDEVRYEFAPVGPGVAFLADASGRLGTEVAEARVLEGRWFDENDASEVVVSFALAERENLSVGSTFQLFSAAEAERAETPEEQAFVDALLDAVPDARFRIVAVVAAPAQFPPLVQGVPHMQFSPAFAALPESSPNSALLMQLDPDVDPDDLVAAVDRLAAEQGKSPALGLHRDLVRDINRSLRPQVVTLAVLSIVLALAGAVVGGQAIARHVDLDAAEDVVLRAVGMTSGDLRGIAALQWAVVGVVAGVAAMATALALSPLSPSGLARIAEPAPGVRVDALAFAVGGAVAAAATLALGIGIAAMRSRRRLPARHRTLATPLVHPVVGIALRRAFDRGGSTRRVPVWSTVVGVTVSVAAVVGALVVGTTLGRQLDDPARYGLRWQLEASQFTENTLATQGPALLAEDERLTGVAVGVGGPTPISGRDLSMLAMDPVRGEVRPPLVRGTYPDAADSVAMGHRTLLQFGVTLGDDVQLDFSEVGGAELSFRVVGELLMPPQGSGGRMDEGIFLSLTGIQRAVDSDEPVLDTLFLAGAPGTDLVAVVDGLVAEIEPDEYPSIERPTTPSDLVDLGRARSMPALFAAGMALAGTAALAHTLLVSVRRRRHETAVLRALGFDNRQLYAATLLQAAALAMVAVVAGIVIGLAAGRLGWGALADSLGSPLPAAVPRLATFAAVPLSVLALSILLSLAPARSATRLRPAAALRTE